MSLTSVQEPDEPTLIRYLIGRASTEEADRLDELSIADEAFALRLRVVEHDLVDAYVGGELTGDTLEGFKSQYLSSPAGLKEVELARALRAYQPVAAAGHVATPRPTRWRVPAWGLAAAAALLLATSASLLIDDLRLRRRISGVREEQAALEQRARQLDAELRRQASATSASEQELARAREALAGVAGRAAGDQPADGGGRLLALVLPAAMRGAATVPSLTIPTGTTAVVVRLPLVSVDFPRYTVTLKKAQGDRVIWRSDRLRAPAPSEQNALPVTVRASLLEPGAYTLEVSGLSARGEAEPLDSYPFRVVR